MKQGSIIAGMYGAIGVLLLASGMVLASKDNKEPVIKIKEEIDVTYVKGADMSVLFEGVAAWDAEDKDVTDNLRIDKIIPDTSGNTATVIYVAYDNSNNVVKESRTVKYQEQPVVSDVPAISTGVEPGNEASGENTAEGTAENTGNTFTDEDTQTSEEMVSTGAPVIKLKQKEVSIAKGASFAPLNYVEEIVDDKDDRSYMFRHIKVVGNYSNQQSGTYNIDIYCTDSEGNQSNVETLTLTVQ